MIFLHNEIDFTKLALNNPELKKEFKTLDSNIVYVEFKEINGDYKTKIVNLTQDVFNEEFKTFDLNKFNENIALANSDFLLDLKEKVNQISEETANNSSDILKFLNKSTFFADSFYLNKQNSGNNSLGGVAGYGTFNYLLSYSKDFNNKKNDDIEEDPNIESNKKQAIISKEIFLTNKLFKIKNISNLKQDDKKDFVDSLIYDKDKFDKAINNIDKLNLDLLYTNEPLFNPSKPTIFIWNIDGIRESYIINQENENLLKYFDNIIFKDDTNLKNISCKCCLRKDYELEDNEIMSKYSRYITIPEAKLISRFNLENVEESDSSMFVCSTCKEKIKENNKILSEYKFILLKEKIGRNSEVEVIEKSFFKNIVELLNSNDFGYVYKINNFDNAYNFSHEFNYKSIQNLTIEQIKENYKTINSFLGKLSDIKEEKHYYIGKYSFLANHYIEDKKKKIFEIDKFFNHFMNYYLNGKKLELNVFVSLLDELYLKNIMSSNSEKLNIDFFKKNYFNFLVKLTNIGVNNMSIKSDLKTKLINLENGVKLDLSNEETIVLAGRVLGYLNSKSKQENKSLDYIANIKNFNVSNLTRILNLTFLKYASAIGENQIKLRASISHLLENLKDVKLNKLAIETLFLIGVLADKDEIKLIKENKKEGEENE